MQQRIGSKDQMKALCRYEYMEMTKNQTHRIVLFSLFIIGIIMGIFADSVIVGGLIGLGAGFFIIVMLSWTERDAS